MMEEGVLRLWKKKDVLSPVAQAREGGPEYIFYEGPPTANGKPGVHHVLARAFKVSSSALQDQCGYMSPPRWLGYPRLPVEIEVEKKLGFHQQAAD